MTRRPHPIVAALTRIRLGCHRSQAALARAVHISQPSVALWESGKRDPKLSQVEAYARVFGLRLALVPLETPDGRKQ
ncbi:helix-turn-helix transcriptional regulator [Streptosporangium sp. G12]